MLDWRILSLVTFLTCFLTCIAYEAIRINGWYNRFSNLDWNDFTRVAFDKWDATSILVYILIFMSFVVVVFSKYNPTMRAAWFLFSLLMLFISCINIPGAMLGRYASTSDMFFMFYLFIIPIPSVVCAVIGAHSRDPNESFDPIAVYKAREKIKGTDSE